MSSKPQRSLDSCVHPRESLGIRVTKNVFGQFQWGTITCEACGLLLITTENQPHFNHWFRDLALAKDQTGVSTPSV